MTPRGVWWSGHPRVGSVWCLGVLVAVIGPAQALSTTQRVFFLSQLGRAGSLPAFLFVSHPVAPQQPVPCRMGGQGQQHSPGHPCGWRVLRPCSPPTRTCCIPPPLPWEGMEEHLGKLAPTKV